MLSQEEIPPHFLRHFRMLMCSGLWRCLPNMVCCSPSFDNHAVCTWPNSDRLIPWALPKWNGSKHLGLRVYDGPLVTEIGLGEEVPCLPSWTVCCCTDVRPGAMAAILLPWSQPSFCCPWAAELNQPCLAFLTCSMQYSSHVVNIMVSPNRCAVSVKYTPGFKDLI